jgi:hypothetical protein
MTFFRFLLSFRTILIENTMLRTIILATTLTIITAKIGGNITNGSSYALNHFNLSLSPYPNNMATASGIAKGYYENHTPLPTFGTGKGCNKQPCKGYCDHYVAMFFGLPSSGFNSAAEHWAEMPASKKLTGWQPGALAFFNGGTYGHIAIGDMSEGMVYSTDVTQTAGGYVGHKTTDWVAQWNKGNFVGWYKPWFK